MNRLSLILTLTLLACAARGSEERVRGPSAWAETIKMKGVANFHKVSPVLYRGGQPTAEGMRSLKQMGIKTIVSLRSYHSNRNEIGRTDLDYEHIYMKPWHPEDKEVTRFLRIVLDPKRAPVFVHCMRGAERTGAICAAYRIIVQGWSKEEAIKEMADKRFDFHEVWDNLPRWIMRLDVEAIRKELGLKPGPPQEGGDVKSRGSR